jgi:hypothetical protein
MSYAQITRAYKASVSSQDPLVDSSVVLLMGDSDEATCVHQNDARESRSARISYDRVE